MVDYEEASAAQPAERLVAPKPIDRDTVAALFHTGGTTGLPKLAKHTHGALTLMAWTNALVFDFGPGTVLLNPLPQFHGVFALPPRYVEKTRLEPSAATIGS